MEDGICGFCHRSNVEDVCGKLHVEKTKDGTVAAHHRCMQYCALLTQYKFAHFGGFKIDKVLAEYKRGKLTKCSICCPKSGKRMKKGDVNVKGATAGCAVRSCRRSFHYYCARKDDTVITKRLVVHVKSKGEKTIYYRVFCSKEHEQLYRQNLKKYLKTDNSRKGSESDEDDVGDNDEDVETANGDEKLDGGALSQEANSTFIQVSDLEDSPRKSVRKQSSVKYCKIDNETTDDEMIRYTLASSSNKRKRPSIIDSEAEKSKKAKTSLTNGKKTVKSVSFSSAKITENVSPSSSTKGSNSGSSSSCSNGKSSPNKKLKSSSSNSAISFPVSQSSRSNDDTEGSTWLNTRIKDKKALDRNGFKVTEVPASPVKYNPYVKVVCDVHSKSTSPSVSSDAKKNTSQTKNKSQKMKDVVAKKTGAVALCIVGDTKCPRSLEKRLAEIVCKKYNIKSKHFFVWQNLDDSLSLSEENMLYFIKDLAKQFIDGQVDEVDKLLFDKRYLQKKDKTEYKLQGSFLQDLGETILQQTQQHVWSLISSQLANKDVGSIIDMEGKHNLVLLLQDQGIDSKGRLREKLGVIAEESDMIVWTPATVVTKVSDGTDTELYDLEKDKILTWFEENIESVGQVFVHPTERILLTTSVGVSVAEDITTHLKAITDKKKSTSIIVFKQVDKEVVNFVPYCRKVIQSILPSCAQTGCSLLVIFDIQSLSNSIHEQLRNIFQDMKGNKLSVTLSSAFDPSSVPISCVMAQVNSDQLQKFK